jgi:phosphatidate cytidylyltransferase
VAAVWLAVAVPILKVGGPVFFALAALLAMVMLFEYYRMAKPLRPIPLAGYVTTLAVLIGAYRGGLVPMAGLLTAGLPLTFVLAAVAPRRGLGVASIGSTLLGALWVSAGVGHVILLRTEFGVGFGLLVALMGGVIASDSVAYFGGRLFGRHQLAPRISPNKTVEGFVAGVIGCVAGVWFIGLYQPWISHAESLVLGGAIAVAAPLGDLFESYVKRDLDVKDSGSFFGGGHGGALDRLDALLFAGVAAYYTARALL